MLFKSYKEVPVQLLEKVDLRVLELPARESRTTVCRSAGCECMVGVSEWVLREDWNGHCAGSIVLNFCKIYAVEDRGKIGDCYEYQVLKTLGRGNRQHFLILCPVCFREIKVYAINLRTHGKRCYCRCLHVGSGTYTSDYLYHERSMRNMRRQERQMREIAAFKARMAALEQTRPSSESCQDSASSNPSQAREESL